MKQTRREFIKSSALTALSLTYLGRQFNVNNSISWLFDDDDQICKSKFSLFISDGLKDRPIGDVIAEIGKSFLGTEYVANTLEINPGTEKLVINLTGLDCVTFVENCLTFARCLKKNKTTFADYEKELESIRYRDGIIDGYASRLHYFVDWIYNNETKGIVKDITADLGGVPYKKTINFMSAHPNSYKQLSDKTNLENIKVAEDAINSRDYYYIPKKSISQVHERLQNGDIIATTTSINGLDVTHTGYVYKGEDGGTYFLHASLKSKKVIISDNSLADYVAEDTKKTGIIVARPAAI